MKEDLPQQPNNLSETQIEELAQEILNGEQISNIPKTESDTESKNKNDDLLQGIPLKDREFARACAGLGEEGLEIFTEMMGNKTMYLDETTAREQKKRTEEILKSFQKYQEALQRQISDKDNLSRARESLGIKTSEEIIETKNIDSIELLNTDMTYKISGPIEGVYYNASHHQDAFSIKENGEVTCVTVCDGVSSRKGSGELSARLSQKLSESALIKPLSDVYDSQSLNQILEEISSEVGSIEGGGSSTLISVRMDMKDQTIEWSSVGDSPLFIVDTDENGDVLSWDIPNEDSVINDANYLQKEILDELKDPETYALRINQEGKIKIPPQERIKKGSVEYKKGRKLVLASDFLTKVLLHSPDVALMQAEYWKNILNDSEGIPYTDTKKKMMSEVWAKIALKNNQEFADLWVHNKSTGNMMLNPLFVLGKSELEIKSLLDEWIKNNPATNDDVTIMTIDLDKYFAE